MHGSHAHPVLDKVFSWRFFTERSFERHFSFRGIVFFPSLIFHHKFDFSNYERNKPTAMSRRKPFRWLPWTFENQWRGFRLDGHNNAANIAKNWNSSSAVVGVIPHDRISRSLIVYYRYSYNSHYCFCTYLFERCRSYCLKHASYIQCMGVFFTPTHVSKTIKSTLWAERFT